MTEIRLHNAEVVKILRNLSSEKQTWYDRKKESNILTLAECFFLLGKLMAYPVFLQGQKQIKRFTEKYRN